jgi:acid phosphatase
VNSSEKYNLVPFTQFATDLANNQLPNFSFIVPNVMDDAHSGTLSQADAWLSHNIAPLLSNPTFQTDGVLIIVFDESTNSDVQGGGGHVAAVVIGPKVKTGYRSTATYQHQSTLKSLLQALGLSSFPGAAENAPDMGEFFTSTTGHVTVTSPTNNSVVNSPVHFVATSTTSCPRGMSAIGIYTAPGHLAYWNSGSNLDHYLSLSPGVYNTTVQAWDNCSNAFKSFINITVQ